MTKLKTKLTLLTCFVLSTILGQSSPKIYSKAQVLQDVDYLYQSLIEAHYQIYAYTNAKAFKNNYQKVKQQLTADSLTVLQSTTILQKVIAAANNGHTEIDFPASAYRDYAIQAGTVFPLELAFENNQTVIRKNFSDNPNLKPGTPIIAINAISVDSIVKQIMPVISAESAYFKKTKLELYSFPRYYWQIFGQQDQFKITVKSKDSASTHLVTAVPVIDGFESKRNEILKPHRQLKFYAKAAYLHPGVFAGNEQHFKKFIDSAFLAIRHKKSSHLIIDLRNHGGGNDSFSDYMVSYLAKKPFTWNSNFSIKISRLLKEHIRKHKDTTLPYYKAILRQNNGSIYTPKIDAYQAQNQLKRFKGKVFVLVNRQSHSQATVTAAQIQDYGLGTIVGETTAEYPTLYASQFSFTLPNTGIVAKVSKGYIVRVNGSTIQEGVTPNIFIKDYLLDEKDEILEKLLAKIP